MRVQQRSFMRPKGYRLFFRGSKSHFEANPCGIVKVGFGDFLRLGHRKAQDKSKGFRCVLFCFLSFKKNGGGLQVGKLIVVWCFFLRFSALRTSGISSMRRVLVSVLSIMGGGRCRRNEVRGLSPFRAERLLCFPSTAKPAIPILSPRRTELVTKGCKTHLLGTNL